MYNYTNSVPFDNRVSDGKKSSESPRNMRISESGNFTPCDFQSENVHIMGFTDKNIKTEKQP